MKSTSSSFFPFFFPLLFILREKKCLTADKATVLAMRAIEQKKTDRERKKEKRGKEKILDREKGEKVTFRNQSVN